MYIYMYIYIYILLLDQRYVWFSMKDEKYNQCSIRWAM